MLKSLYGSLLLRTLGPQALKSQQSANAQDATGTPTSKGDIEGTLSGLCAVPEDDKYGQPQAIPSGRFKMIAEFVRGLDQYSNRQGRQSWYFRPRLFTVLRGIGGLQYMDNFVRADYCDVSLPFDNHTLPGFVKDRQLRQRFLNYQHYVLTDARRLESVWADGEHIHFAAESANEHFLLHHKLGSGGFGSVDAVVSKLSWKPYARKVYHREKDTKRQQFIIDEIKIMKRFSHRHLTEIVGSYTDPDYIAYLMEPVAEMNLSQYLKALGELPRAHAQREAVALRQYFGCLAGAVHYLHQNKVRHRDIKPQNILLKDKQVYVADFGAAVEWTSKSKRGTTQSYNAPRSPDYMAPEIDDRNPRNAASDMWSLGIVFLEMLTVLKGLTLARWKEHLRRKSRTQSEPWPCRNLAALSEWMTLLQGHGSLLESDNEPLMWVRELLQHKPERRYSSQVLVKTIGDSGYLNDFTCFDCIQDFREADHIYGDNQRDTTRETASTRAAYEDQIAALLNTFEPPQQHMSNARANAIDAWVQDTTEYLSVSVSVEPLIRDRTPSHDVSAMLFEEQPLETQFSALSPSEWESGNTAFWEPVTRMPGAFIFDDVSEQSREMDITPTEPRIVEDEIQPQESVWNESDEDLFDVVRDSSIADSDSISVGAVEDSALPDTDQNLQTIIEEEPPTTTLQESQAQVTVLNDSQRNEPNRETLVAGSPSSTPPVADVEPSIPFPEDSPPSLKMGSRSTNVLPQPEPFNALGIVYPSDSVYQKQVDRLNETRPTAIRPSLPSPPETPESRKFEVVETIPDHAPQPDLLENEKPEVLESTTDRIPPADPPPPYYAYPSPPTSPYNDAYPSTPRAAMPEFRPTTPRNDFAPSSPQPSSPKKSKSRNKSRVAPRPPPRRERKSPRSFNPSDFSPVQYIEDAWKEMEAAKSLATSVMSEATSRRLRGPLLKKFDHDYSYMEKYAQDGISAAVKRLLDQGCNPGTHQKPRPKPLLLAIKGVSDRHNKCVKALIRAGCDVNARFRKRTPIHWAVERPFFSGYLKLLALLLGAGAEMDTPDADGDYPLLKLLAGVPDEPLETHKVKALALILHPQVISPVDVNVRQAVSLNTALHIAVQRRTPAAVAVLLHHGADVNAENASATTPLLMAATQWRGALTLEQEMILSFLLQDEKLDVDVKGGSLERTALHHACAAGCATALGMLIERGADTSSVDKNGMRALDVLNHSREKMTVEVFDEMRELLRG